MPRSQAPSRLADLPADVGRRPAAEELRVAGLLPGAAGSATWWAAAADAGTPLRCPDGLPGADGQPSGVPTLVFLHRDAREPAAYVDLGGLTDRSDPGAGTMRRLPGTDVHVAAFGVPAGFVASYALIPLDGPLRSPAPRNTPQARAWWLGVLARAVPDPLARGARYRDSRGSLRDVAEAPGAAPDAPAGPAGPAGTAPAHTCRELVWDRPDGVAQPVWLHAPRATPPRGPAEAGVLVVFDGRMWAERVPLAPAVDALHARGAVPPTAVVMVDALTPDRRAADLAGEDGYLDLLADDLLPRVVAPTLAAAGWTLSADPARAVVAGQSYGGLAAFRVVARRPDRFGAVVSQSGSFWWPSMHDPAGRAVVGALRDAPPRAARTVLQVGAYEDGLTDANRELAAAIRARGEHLVYEEVPGGHDWAWWSRRLAGALPAALGRDRC